MLRGSRNIVTARPKRNNPKIATTCFLRVVVGTLSPADHNMGIKAIMATRDRTNVGRNTQPDGGLRNGNNVATR
jgi:hypothetical protein